MYLHCTNDWNCGYRCKAEATILETLVPSRCPSPTVHIKLSPWLKQRVELENQGQIRLIDEPKKEPKR